MLETCMFMGWDWSRGNRHLARLSRRGLRTDLILKEEHFSDVQWRGTYTDPEVWNPSVHRKKKPRAVGRTRDARQSQGSWGWRGPRSTSQERRVTAGTWRCLVTLFLSEICWPFGPTALLTLLEPGEKAELLDRCLQDSCIPTIRLSKDTRVRHRSADNREGGLVWVVFWVRGPCAHLLGENHLLQGTCRGQGRLTGPRKDSIWVPDPQATRPIRVA